MGQIFSAWAAPMDDPLRITVENGRLFARLEAGSAYSTQGMPLEIGKWYDATVSKNGAKLTLTVDGKERSSCAVPAYITTRANDFAVGGNPHFGGSEFVEAEVENLQFEAN